MRDYTVTFIEPVDLETLAQAVSDAFVIPRDQIEVWNGEDFITPVAEPVVAQVASVSGYGCYESSSASTRSLSTLGNRITWTSH